MSTTPSYNLIDHAWIPLRTLDGGRCHAGLHEVLTQPQRFSSIDSTHPTQALAILRLLLAVAHRAVGPGRLEDRAALLDKWPADTIDGYLQKWRSRFDLHHPSEPFLQVAALKEVTGLRPRPWTVLAVERASGNNRTLFDHTVDERLDPIDDAELVRQFLAHLQFTPGGLVKALRTSAIRGAGCGLLCVVALGNTLQQTLALNLLPQSAHEHERDRAAWEQATPRLEALRQGMAVVPAGPAQRYTFLSRAVLLGPSVGPRRHIDRYAEGLVMAEAPTADPMAAQRLTDKGPVPVLLREDRAFWRDLQALTAAQGSQPPATVNTALAIRLEAGDPEPLALWAGGFLPNQAKPVLWRLEERRVPPSLLMAEGATARLLPALRAAETTGRALEWAMRVLAEAWIQGGGERLPDKTAVNALVQQLNGMPRYWQQLEPEFWRLTDRLGGGSDPDAALALWADALDANVRNTWRATAGQLGLSARALAAAARADRPYGHALRQASTLGKEQ
jgi:CRISPR system Cascade subunit CasA